MKDLGVLSWFLGIEFKCQKDIIEMNQTKYVEKILKRFQRDDCKPRSTPCDVDSKSYDSKELSDATLYRDIVGSLIYCMSATRPDLCYMVTKLSQHMSKPTKVHLGMAKHVLRYLKCTFDYSHQFRKSDTPLELSGFSDADWGTSDNQ